MGGDAIPRRLSLSIASRVRGLPGRPHDPRVARSLSTDRPGSLHMGEALEVPCSWGPWAWRGPLPRPGEALCPQRVGPSRPSCLPIVCLVQAVHGPGHARPYRHPTGVEGPVHRSGWACRLPGWKLSGRALCVIGDCPCSRCSFAGRRAGRVDRGSRKGWSRRPHAERDGRAFGARLGFAWGLRCSWPAARAHNPCRVHVPCSIWAFRDPICRASGRHRR